MSKLVSPEINQVFAEYERQGIELHDKLFDVWRTGSSGLPSMHTPTPMLAAIAVAGDLLRQDSAGDLASGVLEPTTPITDSLTAKIFSAIVNASLEPVYNTHSDRNFKSPEVPAAFVCKEAERQFARTIHALDRPRHRDFRPADIVVGENGEPLFLKKALKERTALSLVDTNVNGIPYPAGSLFRLDLEHSYEVAKSSRLDNQHVWAAPVGVVESIAFARLSAFALPPRLRRKVFDNKRPKHELFDDIIDSPRVILATKSIQRVARDAKKALR